MSSPAGSDQSAERVRRTIAERLAQIDSPEKADEVVRRIAQGVPSGSEQEVGDRTAEDSAPAAVEVERAGAAPDEAGAAATLIETAAQAVAPTDQAGAVVAGAQEALTERADTPVSPDAERGRQVLKAAMLKRMAPLQALDARVYLAINGVPHPPWLDAVGHGIAVLTRGGALWVAGTLVAYVLRVPRSKRALTRLLLSVVGATWAVEFPIKRAVRRRRPFVDVVSAIVVGKKPGSWSYPSGHTTASFACARVLSSVWPGGAPVFYTLASVVGVSRVYVGDHYPGDVLSGATCGLVLAEVLYRLVRRVLG